MKRSFIIPSLVGAATAASISGCASPDLSGPCPVPPNATPAQVTAAKMACYGGMGQTSVDIRPHKDVDVLFMIDNSPSMSPKQKALAQAIPAFINRIDQTGSNYHVGIVTSDLGFNVPNGSATGTPFPGNVLVNCNTAAGDDGVLQNTACSLRTGLTGEALSACQSLCPDARFVPNGGARYISKQDGITNVPVNMQGGMDIGPQSAFQCMALIGDTGCGVEHQLESVKRALDNHRPDNTGFNRGTSVLAVIFITDEDDSSVQLMNRAQLNPATPNEAAASCNTATPTPGVKADCFNVDFRTMATDLTCTEPMNTKGRKTNCTERKDTLLTSIDSYVNFFSSLPNPSLVLAGIWTPTMLDNVSSDPTKDGQLYVDFVSGAMDSAGLNRGTPPTAANGMMQTAACYTPDPTMMLSKNPFFGQAQYRNSSFLRRFNKSNISEHSICDVQPTMNGGYVAALQVIADNISNASRVDCLSGVPKTVNGVPECVVGFVDASQPAATPDTLLPVCSQKCCNYFATDPSPNFAHDPNRMPNPEIAAITAACGSDPDCYCAVPSAVNCTTPAAAVAGVWRKGNAAAPAGKVVDFRCAIQVAGP